MKNRKINIKTIMAVLSLFTVVSCGQKNITGHAAASGTSDNQSGTPAISQTSSFTITSPDFKNGSRIPPKFTCDGSDELPRLIFSGIPENAKSLALIIEDPDAPDPENPGTIWTHLVLFNIIPACKEIAKDTGGVCGACIGSNDWKQQNYKGPCPPVGEHRYFFKLYALDSTIDNIETPDREALLNAMEGHIINKTQLTGTYSKQNKKTQP
jgi:Raf kinase inhibitor-like YbhB/YbcL family protein